MTCLHKLGIEEIDESSDVRKLFASLTKLDDMYCLNLRGFRFKRMPRLDKIGVLCRLCELRIDGRLARLPSRFPQRISHLSLVNTFLDEDPMPVIEKLTYLQFLKLRNAYTGREMVIRGFIKLEVLCINEMWNLRNLQVEEGAMCLLRQLEIKKLSTSRDPPTRNWVNGVSEEVEDGNN